MSDVPLLNVDLSPEDVADLYRDLAALTQMRSVRISEGAGARACRLDEAFAALEARTATRALLHYTFDGRAWADTLLATTAGLRLVRIDEQDAVSAQEAEDAKGKTPQPPSAGDTTNAHPT